MKKILLCLFAAIVLTNCEISPRKASADDRTYYNMYNPIYDYREEEKSGMIYGIWYVKDKTSQTGYSTAVVNITKEKLEVEYLQLQIDKLKKK